MFKSCLLLKLSQKASSYTSVYVNFYVFYFSEIALRLIRIKELQRRKAMRRKLVILDRANLVEVHNDAELEVLFGLTVKYI